MKTLLGREGGFERVILCVSTRAGYFVYLAVRPWKRYYRASLFVGTMPWVVQFHRSRG